MTRCLRYSSPGHAHTPAPAWNLPEWLSLTCFLFQVTWHGKGFLGCVVAKLYHYSTTLHTIFSHKTRKRGGGLGTVGLWSGVRPNISLLQMSMHYHPPLAFGVGAELLQISNIAPHRNPALKDINCIVYGITQIESESTPRETLTPCTAFIMPTVFITAASGHIGSKLIPLLLKTKDLKLVLPTSNAIRLTSSIPKSDAITIVEGSIQDPQWVEKQLRSHNVDTVFLCLTGSDELFTTLNIFSALERTISMKHIVYLSACGDFSPSPGFKPWKAAHCAVKAPIEMALRGLGSETGLTYTILGPTLFFDNDLRQKDAMLKQGIYPEPLGKNGGSRISTDDIADAVRIAVLDQGKKWNEKKVMLGTKEKYNVSE